MNRCLGSARTLQSASGRIVCLRQQMSSTLIAQTVIENTAFACSNSTWHRAQEYAIRPRLCQGSPQCQKSNHGSNLHIFGPNFGHSVDRTSYSQMEINAGLLKKIVNKLILTGFPCKTTCWVTKRVTSGTSTFLY